VRSVLRAQNKKARLDFSKWAFEINPGGDLRSRAVTSAVSSARRGLTSVFGMGTGVALAVRPPGNWKIELEIWNSQSELGSREFRIPSFDGQLKEASQPQIPQRR
jgi:hypothetical protein